MTWVLSKVFDIRFFYVMSNIGYLDHSNLNSIVFRGASHRIPG